MRISGNTIFIPGATSGIGLALAQRLHEAGNTVIVGGRRAQLLDEIAERHPGLDTIQIDTADAASIASAAETVIARHPDLDVLVTMAGIMRIEDWTSPAGFVESAEQTVATNLLGPIRLIGAFIEHLRAQKDATIMTVSSGLAFAPLRVTPSYNATKAAVHMLSESVRLQLAETNVSVLELEPPAVRTGLLPGQEGRVHALRAHAVAALHEELRRVCRTRIEAAEALTVTAAELAAALNVGQRSARAMVDECLTLAEPGLAPVLDALRDGRLTRRRARAVMDLACIVPPEGTEAFCAAAVDLACPDDASRAPSPGALGRRLRRLVEDYTTEPLAARKERAAAFRRVDLEPGKDGMCWLTAHLPLEVGAAIDTRLEALARSLQGPDEVRGISQLRADAFRDLLLDSALPVCGPAAVGSPVALAPAVGSPATGRHRAEPVGGAGPMGGVRTELVVTVPARTLTGESEAPGEILGHGPLDAPTARLLAAEAASWTTMFVDPHSGAPLGLGRRRYTPSLAIRRFLGARDRVCRFPGCDKPAPATEADHTTEWQHGGATDATNLALLCREHHRLKTLGLWSVRQFDEQETPPTETWEFHPDRSPAKSHTPQSVPSGGVLEWTSPTGRRYVTHPESDAPPPF
ncbi:SDR family NAD(P)-dependent oxidoreductase [Sinomonas sp. JGH33]|uniref:SDR family NAD(P)-dependent oxidoreductase n=1 Tax=Sinomonas terricola TaxID=3110330 RepID=A0ABU5T324_9MICC|nr:SDR family NAD(P)-dependent oxidoreductase [Sinomonas sp. JGH33]MEA5453965.1 SDR family NAD(P)-dependent oxidoreductase [Sinomonas sp. JGH33]